MESMKMIRSLESAIKNKSLYEHISSEKLSAPNNYFEVLSDKYSMRPFVDLDGEFTDDISKEEFEAKDTAIIERLKELENVSVMTSSNYEALKITKVAGKSDKKEIKMKLSYRVIWTNERVNNIIEMKKVIKEQKFALLEELLSETIEVTEKSKDNAVNVDYAVYRQGDGKMRCVNAFKHPEQPERINKLVKGSIEDTFININQDELDKYQLLLPQTEIERQKKQEEREKKLQAKDEEKSAKQQEREKKKDEKLETIIKQHKEKKEKKQKDKDEKEIDKKIKDRVFTEEQIVELLSIIGNTADWQQWNNYGLILHDNWYSFEAFNNWSKLNKKYVNDTAQNKQQWNNNYPVATGKWAVYTFLKDAKQVNPEKYKEWCKKCKQPHILSLLKQGADAVDEEYKAELFETLKYSKGSWYNCNTNNLWIELSTPEKAILTFIRGHMEGCEDMMKAFEVGGFLALLKKNFETSLCDNDFCKKLCTPIDHIAFKNGLYNLQTKIFQKGFKPDNFISKTLDYDFDKNFKSNANNKKYIMTEFIKLCSNKEELFDYLFCMLGFILTGRASEVQEFFSIIGQKGGNGKSTLFIILKQIFSIYVKQTSPKCFEADYAKAHKDLATLQGIRYLVSEEFRKGASLNEQLVKRFRDGTPMENEVMFGTLSEIELQCKLLFTSNSTLKFEADGGMSRGYREVKFSSRFVSDYAKSEYKHEVNCFQADKSFQTEKFLQPEYRDELLHILLEYSHKYYQNGLKTPDFITEASQQTCEMQGDQFKSFFDDYYQIDPEGFVLKEELASDHLEYYKKALNLMQIKDEFQKISDTIIYDKDKKGKGENREKRGGFRGISKRVII